MIQPIKYGIVGVGGFGRQRRDRLRAAGCFEIVGGVDTRPAAFTEAEREEGKPLRQYPSVEALAADPEIAAVFIATPAHLHVEQAFVAARGGKAIYTEKPLGHELATCRQLVEYCEQHGIAHGHGFGARYLAIWQYVQQLVARGVLGRIISVSAATMHTGGFAFAPDNWRFAPGYNPGGPLFQCGIHKLDLLRFLFGEGEWLAGNIRRKNYTKLLQDTVYMPLFNRALMAMYPPGSTFKLVDALVGQQEGVLFPETRYGCQGGFPLGNGKKVGCHPHPSPLDLVGAIQISCNAYFCRVFKSIIDKSSYSSTRQAYESWRKEVMSFGFGKKLGIDIPGELNGNIPSPSYYDKYHGLNRWRSMTIISLAIGQGEIGITPMQLANQAALISNRGWYYTPHVIRAIGRKDSLNEAYNVKHKVLVDERYFEVVIEGMADVVTGGTGRVAQLDSIVICGKTGTAQNPHGKNHSLFIAFAPRNNAKIAISVVVENAGTGALWAAPIASLMIEKYLNRTVKRKELEERMVSGNLINGKQPESERGQGNILPD